MYKKMFIGLAALTAVACGGANGRRAEKIERAASVAVQPQEVAGTYVGTIPAADCPGIAVSLTLAEDGAYESRSEYLERDFSLREYGRYTIEDGRLTLYPDEGEAGASYRIEAGRLRMLDREGRPIEGALADYYVLTRKTDR